MDNNPSISCSECKFYFSFGDGETTGECRKNPPVLFFVNEMYFRTEFPETNDLLWCGEFARDFSTENDDEDEEYSGPFDYEGNKISIEISDDDYMSSCERPDNWK